MYVYTIYKVYKVYTSNHKVSNPNRNVITLSKHMFTKGQYDLFNKNLKFLWRISKVLTKRLS